MSDFVQLAQTFGLPLAMTITATLILARVIVVVTREKDKVSESRYDEMKRQFEARIQEQRAQYEDRLRDVEDDRDWNRDRLRQALGIADAKDTTIEEVVRRVARQSQLPPQR